MSHTAKSKHKPKSRDRVVRLFTPTLPGMEMGWQRIVRQADRLVLLAPGSDPQPDGRSGYRHLVAGGCRKGGEPLHPKPTWTLAEGTQVAGAALMDVTGTVLAYFLYREPVRLLTGDGVTVDRVEIDRSIAKGDGG